MKEKEAHLMKYHQELKQIPKQYKGIDSLVKRLTELQKDMLLGSKVKVIEQLVKKWTELKQELDKMPMKIQGEYDKERKISKELKMVETLFEK